MILNQQPKTIFFAFKFCIIRENDNKKMTFDTFFMQKTHILMSKFAKKYFLSSKSQKMH